MRTHNIGLLICITIATLLTTAHSAHAAKVPVFFSWGGEQIIKVADFPDTEDFKALDGKYLDPGYRYKHISLFFVPIWNYSGQWCGYVGDSDHYLDLDKAELDVLAGAAGAAGVKLPATPSLPFWDSYGGKLLLLAVFAFFISGKSRTESPNPPEDKAQEAGNVA